MPQSNQQPAIWIIASSLDNAFREALRRTFSPWNVGFSTGDSVLEESPNQLAAVLMNPLDFGWKKCLKAVRQNPYIDFAWLINPDHRQQVASQISNEAQRELFLSKLFINTDQNIVSLSKALKRWQKQIAERLSTTSSPKETTTSPTTPSSPIDVPDRLRPGAQVDCYSLIRRLGKGHSASVWLCEVRERRQGLDLKPGDKVAVKFYEWDLFERFSELIRIHREYGVVAKIAHPNIVRVHDLILSSRPHHAFLAMEYIEGLTLKSHIPQEGLPIDSVILYGQQLLSALEEVHSHDVIHRDVKPANILVPSESRVVLLDFGIVQLMTQQGLTTMGRFIGSKHYAPLEQLCGESPEVRWDIYGVGATLFHCYSGREMYANKTSDINIALEMRENPEILMPRFGDSQPRGERLMRAINSFISVDPEKRPNNAREALALLESI